jgi:HlyD family secretion protein
MTDRQGELLAQLRIDRDHEAPEPARRWPARLAWSLALVACAGIAYWMGHGAGSRAAAARGAGEAAADAPAPAGPGGAAASPGTSAGQARARPAALDASGFVVARRSATVSAPIPGRVVEVLIDAGSHVTAGSVMARLDDRPYRIRLDQVRAALEQARAQQAAARTALSLAEPAFRRYTSQHAGGFISEQDYDTARTQYEAAKSNAEIADRAVATAATQVTGAERDLTDTVIRAPFSGVITYKGAQAGEIVSPVAQGGGFTRTGIGTIVDMDSLEVEVDVNESYINRVHAGQGATVRLNAYPDWQIPASVIAIIPTADRAKATVKVRIAFRQRDARILPEMGARVSFDAEAAGR